MRAHALVGLTILAGTMVACATGSEFPGSGGSNAGGSGGSGAAGGATTTSGTTDTSTTTTSGTTGSTTTSTPTCEESPCKLVAPQCGCDAGDMCAINTSGDRECHAPGTSGFGEICTGFYGCFTGALCVTASTTKSLCAPYCDDDAQCGGGLCVLQLNDPDDPTQVLPDVKLCSESCNPITGSGCPAGNGLGCHLFQEPDGQMRTFTLCTGSGAGAQNASCTDSEDCAPGSACFTFTDGSMKCLQYCNVDSPSCAVCQSLDPPVIYNGVNYGACL